MISDVAASAAQDKSNITKQINKTSLKNQLIRLGLTPFTPSLKPPTIKTPPNYKPFPKALIFGSGELKKKIRAKRWKEIPENFGLMPDFTARALGLSPKEFSVKGAMKEIKKLRTGFEIRTGGRIKGYTPIDEKSLLRGIWK